jgi:hypothetical protein
MIGKKINQLATELAPESTDLTIIGDPVTGVSKKITLLQIADLFTTLGTVTSVAVTETGNALTITGSPITSAGTINIGFAGAATQYVRGDGQLSDFPTSTGGGSSVSYYLNSSVSQGTIGGVAYRQFSKTPIAGAGTDISVSANGYIASYITDANDPALLEVPAGNFNCELYFSVDSNNHNPYVYAEVYKYDGTTFTLLGSSQSVPEYLTSGTTLSPYYFAVPVTATSLTITDRIAIRIYANVDGRTVTLHTENSHLCQVVTTFSKGLTSLNNLTRQVQFLATGTTGTDFNIASSTATHTFNLPTASATNRGALSSTDWTTFNNKQNALTNPVTGTGTSGQVTYFNGTSTVAGSSNHFWDATNNRLGIGLNNPQRSLEIYNATADSHLRLSGTAPSVSLGEAITGSIYQAKFGLITANGQYVTGGVAGDFVILSQTGSTIFATSSTEKMRVQASGNVSIGNTNDIYKLDVSGAGRYTGVLYADNTIRLGIALIGQNSNNLLLSSNSAVGEIGFYSNALGSKLMTLNGSGNLSIGNINDTYKLDVSGTVRFTGQLRLQSTITDGTNTYTLPSATGTLALTSALSGYLPLTGGTLTGALGGTSASFSSTLGVTGLTTATGGIVTNSIKSANTAANLVIGTDSASGTSLVFTTDFSERMRINASGNVSINNTNDTYKLDVTGTGRFYRNDSGNISLILTNDYINQGNLINFVHNSGGSTTNGYIGHGGDSTGNFVIINNSITALSLARSTGAATFSSSVTATSGKFASANGTTYAATSQLRIDGNGVNNSYAQITFTDSALSDGKISYFPAAAAENRYFSISPRQVESDFVIRGSNVGIGTTSPVDYTNYRSLHIMGATSTSSAILYLTNSTSSIRGLFFAEGNASRVTIGSQSNHDFTFLTNDTERMRITSGGNVGIGTSSPSARLHVGNGTQTAINGADNKIHIATTGTRSALLTLANSSGGTTVEGQFESSAESADLRIIIGSTTNHPVVFRTNNVETARITSGGNLLIGQTATDPAAALAYFQLTQNYANWIHQIRNSATSGGVYGSNIVFSSAPNNSASAFFAGSDSSAERYRMYANGGLANYQANNVNLSDERTKKDIAPLESYWNKFKAIEMVKFKYKDQTHDDFNIGVIAQQVEKVAPEFVDVDGWGDTQNSKDPLKSIYTSDLHHATIKVLQEAMAKIEDQQNQINELKSQLNK